MSLWSRQINTQMEYILHLKKDFPKLKEEDYRLFLYLMFGFSARSISLFMGEKIEVVYNRKSRLKSKIKNSNATLKNEYLEYCSVIG